MDHSIGIQHVLTNSSAAEKAQQCNYTQTDGQQKHVATKLQREREIQKKKTQQMERSNQMKVKKEGERQGDRTLPQPKRAKIDPSQKNPSKGKPSEGEPDDGSTVDILI
ncbi:MAG: hypothetical protein ACMUIA_11370 [bacterium]